jgi:hypothetical protein
MLALFAAALLPAPSSSAQTAAELDRLLAVPAVDYADAAWLNLSAAAVIPPDMSPAGAYQTAADKHWLPFGAEAGKPATRAGLAFLIMQAFDIKGGLLYSLHPGPRYGYRELVYRRIITGPGYPSLPVSGDYLLRLLSRTLEYTGRNNNEY